MTKSFVSLEAKVCPCCHKQFETNALLLDRTVKDTLEKTTVTGYMLCSTCKKEGYLLCVEISNASEMTEKRVTPERANKTGRVIYIKEDMAKELFQTDTLEEFVYIDKGVYNYFENLVNKEEKERNWNKQKKKGKNND